MMHRSALAVAVMTTVTACVGDETVAAYGGADKTWQVVEVDGAAFPHRATLTFAETGTIQGEAPCNRYSASMTVPYPWFETGPIAQTKRSCPDAAAEAVFLAALADMTLSEVLGDTLVLSTPEGRSMVFKAAG